MPGVRHESRLFKRFDRAHVKANVLYGWPYCEASYHVDVSPIGYVNRGHNVRGIDALRFRARNEMLH